MRTVAYTSQCLPSKAIGRQCLQVGELLQFRRSVSGTQQRQISFLFVCVSVVRYGPPTTARTHVDAMPIIRDLDELETALLDRHFDRGGPGVQRVLD
jgi:hypothetical protein